MNTITRPELIDCIVKHHISAKYIKTSEILRTKLNKTTNQELEAMMFDAIGIEFHPLTSNLFIFNN